MSGICLNVYGSLEATDKYRFMQEQYDLMILYIVFDLTFSNISAISRWPVLVVEEARVPGENHRPWASNW